MPSVDDVLDKINASGMDSLTPDELEILKNYESFTYGGMRRFVPLFEEFSRINERKFSEERREKDAESGAAMPDGSFPIETVQDLKNAIKAHGRAKDIAAAKSHIRRRAKALGQSDLIPEDWK